MDAVELVLLSMVYTGEIEQVGDIYRLPLNETRLCPYDADFLDTNAFIKRMIAQFQPTVERGHKIWTLIDPHDPVSYTHLTLPTN